MEDFWTRQSLSATDAQHGPAATRSGDAHDTHQADDPLGDEAAFPSTWQTLGDDPRFD